MAAGVAGFAADKGLSHHMVSLGKIHHLFPHSHNFSREFMSPHPGVSGKRVGAVENIFHSYLIQLVGNPYISSVMNLVLDHNMRFVVLGARLPNRLEHSNDEHVQILNALLDGNEKAAEELMREHIQYARVSAFESMSLSPAMVGNILQDSAHNKLEK
jgi:DNA-binding FadR family transcriptional regulator